MQIYQCDVIVTLSLKDQKERQEWEAKEKTLQIFFFLGHRRTWPNVFFLLCDFLRVNNDQGLPVVLCILTEIAFSQSYSCRWMFTITQRIDCVIISSSMSYSSSNLCIKMKDAKMYMSKWFWGISIFKALDHTYKRVQGSLSSSAGKKLFLPLFFFFLKVSCVWRCTEVMILESQFVIRNFNWFENSLGYILFRFLWFRGGV